MTTDTIHDSFQIINNSPHEGSYQSTLKLIQQLFSQLTSYTVSPKSLLTNDWLIFFTRASSSSDINDLKYKTMKANLLGDTLKQKNSGRSVKVTETENLH